MELHRGVRVGAAGGRLEREGERERVGAREQGGEEAAREEEERAGRVRRGGEPPERGVEVVGGRGGEGVEEEQRMGERSESARQSRKRARRPGWAPRWPEVRRRAWNCL